MNPEIPLEIFLPPDNPKVNHVNLIVAEDVNGLNAGIFAIRVCPRSVDFLLAVLAHPIYRREIALYWGEQTAMTEVMRVDTFANSFVYVPKHWFNSYP